MKVNNTSPLVIGEAPNQQQLTRRFLGNLFPDNCYEKNELNAYIKGHSRFAYKKDEQGHQIFYPVRQEYFYA